MGLRLIPSTFTLRRLTVAVFAVSAMTVLAGCARDKELAYKETPMYELYSQAVQYLEQGRDEEAAKYFDEVERQYPY